MPLGLAWLRRYDLVADIIRMWADQCLSSVADIIVLETTSAVIIMKQDALCSLGIGLSDHEKK